MKQEFYNLQINTNGQKLYEFTDQTIQWINDNHLVNGILNLSIQHTSASLLVQENADPDVQTDLINYFDKLVPMNNKLYVHTTEGKDDMPAHIKSALTNNQISLSIKDSKLLLGTWQGLYLFEHRINQQNSMSFTKQDIYNALETITEPGEGKSLVENKNITNLVVFGNDVIVDVSISNQTLQAKKKIELEIKKAIFLDLFH